MVAKTQTAAKADSQSEQTQEQDSTTRKAASKTKSTAASSKASARKAAKEASEKKTASKRTQAAKTSRRGRKKTADSADSTNSIEQAVQKSLVVEEAAGELLNQSSREVALNPISPSQATASQTTASQPVNFVATDHMSGDIWQPNSAIPSLDEATYATQKAQAEGQRRALEVASLNLENINSLHQLERQSIDVAISTQMNKTRSAQLTGAEIDYQRQLAVNGEKSQHLEQATAKHEAAIRETGYADQLIALKDQNFELEIQQAQNVFAEKAARYRAQLTGE